MHTGARNTDPYATLGLNHPDVTTGLNNLGIVCYDGPVALRNETEAKGPAEQKLGFIYMLAAA